MSRREHFLWTQAVWNLDHCVCCMQAGRWGQNWVLLHVYIDNIAGVNLYRENGYAELENDPEWQKFLGRRRRFLLAKQAAVTGTAGIISSITQKLNILGSKPEELS